MDVEIIEQCESILNRLKKNKNIDAYRLERNQLFTLMKNDIVKWVEFFLSGKPRGVDRNDILSTSWDCFEYALSKYKGGSRSFCNIFNILEIATDIINPIPEGNEN